MVDLCKDYKHLLGQCVRVEMMDGKVYKGWFDDIEEDDDDPNNIFYYMDIQVYPYLGYLLDDKDIKNIERIEPFKWKPDHWTRAPKPQAMDKHAPESKNP